MYFRTVIGLVGDGFWFRGLDGWGIIGIRSWFTYFRIQLQIGHSSYEAIGESEMVVEDKEE